MSSIATLKKSMGWTPMNRRPACANCRHVEERVTCGISTWWCGSGQLLTNALAICERHAPRGADAAQAVPQ